MKRKFRLLALMAVVLWGGQVAWADGDFYVISGGGPPVGTKITSVPYLINLPGFYFLSGNYSHSGTSGAAITINADDVTLDLMGFSLTHTGDFGTSMGIGINGRSNVEIRNGTVRGFNDGIIVIVAPGQLGENHRVINVRTIGNNSSGIALQGRNFLIKGCTSSNNKYGIFISAGKIVDSVACNNTYSGISLSGAGSLLGNIADENTTYGFYLITVNPPVVVDQNSANFNGTNYFGGGVYTVWGVNAGR
jgi:hypothetical protein